MEIYAMPAPAEDRRDKHPKRGARETVQPITTSTVAQIIDITVSQDGQASAKRKELHADNFRDWLTEKEITDDPEGEPATRPHRLTLVLAGCGQQSKAIGREEMTEFPLPQSQQPWLPPFSSQDYNLLCVKLGLPQATNMMIKSLWADRTSLSQNITPIAGVKLPTEPHADKVSYFQASAPPVVFGGDQGSKDDASGNIVITMKLPESNLVGMDASISISHMVSDRSTNAFLLCRHWHQALYISEIVISHAAALTHPAALPSILCNLYQSVLLRRISSTWGDVFKVELKGGRSGITLFDPSRRRLSSENSDDPELSRAAIKVAQLSAAWDSYTPRIRELVMAVKSFVETYATNHVRGQAGILATQSQVLKDYLDLESQIADSLVYRAKNLLARSNIQVEAINNHLAHTSNQINLSLAQSSRQLAMDARRDASSMKSIALLTMTFLPATFVASLFGTPGVSSADPPQWLYWSVSVPLTAIVLGTWALWTYHKEKTMRLALETGPLQGPRMQSYPSIPGEQHRLRPLTSNVSRPF